MAGISEFLNIIKNNRYGKDIRMAIHDAIQQCYTDAAGESKVDKNQGKANAGKILGIGNDGAVKPVEQLSVAAKSIGTEKLADHAVTEEKLADAVNKKIDQSISDVTALKDDLTQFNCVDYLHGTKPIDHVLNGVSYIWNGLECTVNGTATGISFSNICGSTATMPDFIKGGETYNFKIQTTDRNIYIKIFLYVDGKSEIYDRIELRDDTIITLPENISAFLMRVEVTTGNTANGVISVHVLNTLTNKELKEYTDNNSVMPRTRLNEGTNLNNIVNSGIWLVTDTDAQKIIGLPDYYTNKACWLISTSHNIANNSSSKRASLQIIIGYNQATKVFKRSMINDTSWTDWREIGTNVVNNYMNDYNFEHYSNTYNITANPTIRTDTNSYLESTNDATDRTADILTMLNTTGVCRLGKGSYFVKNLVMPDRTTICGCGYLSVLHLIGDGDSFTVKMSDYCVVKDLMLLGNESSIAVSETVGNRHGILWQGDYTENNNSTRQPKMGIIDNVYIAYYKGGGITCYDTGYGTFNQLAVTNCYIWGCDCGVNISYWSEFHKFTNVRCYNNYYGCINNGGNNVFVNCDFSTNKMGMLMDNANGQSPNNSHGSAIGCVFNHTNGNAGIGIKILNCDAGFIFSSCQIFYSQIYIEESDGVVVSDTNFGTSNCDITIKGGGVVMFVNNLHGSLPAISVSNNNNVHFKDCYIRSTGAVVSN